MRNKKGQTNGLVTGLIMGISALVIVTIIALVVTSTIADADLLTAKRTTVTTTSEIGHLNSTGYTLAGASADYVSGTFTITAIANYTDGVAITGVTSNSTVSSAGVLTNATTFSLLNASINYTYTLKSGEELSEEYIDGNFTSAIDNVSEQIPTLLLIAAVVLLMTLIGVLIAVWYRMQGGGNI